MIQSAPLEYGVELATVNSKVDMNVDLPWHVVRQLAVLAYLHSISFDQVLESVIEKNIGDINGG